MSPAPADDAAWVRLSLPLDVPALHDFLQDVERLLRINPCFDFDVLIRNPDGTLHIEGRNESNDQRFATTVERLLSPEAMGLVLRYQEGIKRETRFEIVADTGGGTVLTMTDVYDTPASDQREQRLQEVDRSLMRWAAALRTHLLRRQRWGNFPGYRWLVERFWLGMPPRQRRVAWLIVWTTALEFLAFLAVLAIFLVR